MKRLTVLLFSIVFLMVSWPAGATAAPPRQDRARERLVTMRNWKLMQEMDLTGEKAQRVFDILKKYDDKRERLILRRRRLLKALRDETGRAEPSEEVLKRLMKDLVRVNVGLAGLPEEEIKGLSEVFSLQEQARYLLFVERFGREMHRILRESRNPDRRRERPRR
ncbi:MAG: hypothetical protein JRJ09_12425 [Deltaproteobacteria bacterium]|nr:hypothetical protein [Deltaproteobacteria bacterium]MBW2049313.1 hypothetical protein [Deltaproteobacteria bacterium]MBW2110079.1 hypothetical protein [Deltaproteobacteria bacterium]MBW2352962.1 hypothetical protein [Deltaproteobacteria bacterium]HDZ91640.1 hypothetical protein [Deltaproteobacteria bacterium]